MSIRTFVAVPINEQVRARLAAVCDTLAETQARVKWVRPENIHLTLAFVGDVPDAMAAALSDAVQESTGSTAPFSLRITGTGFFGRERSPRVIWAGVDGDTTPLANIQSHLVAALRALDLKIEDRPSLPT